MAVKPGGVRSKVRIGHRGLALFRRLGYRHDLESRALACLERLDASTSRVLAPGGGALAPDPSASSIALLVGPEGGWSTTELSQLSDLGVANVGLGPRVLRVETAAVVAAALALATS